jgi:hypothetical protein
LSSAQRDYEERILAWEASEREIKKIVIIKCKEE